jgi:hypothetical protein
MLGVSLGLMEFMQVALGITDRTPRDLKSFLPEWELDQSDLNTQAGSTSEVNVGRGDAVAILPSKLAARPSPSVFLVAA